MLESDPQLCHERMGDAFEEAISEYDTRRRIEVLIGEFLSDRDLKGRRALEVGCGLGHFSKPLADLGVDLTVCDIGGKLVEKASARAGCRGVVADATRLEETFEPGTFDLVLSSECIEHTPDPLAAVSQMCLMLKAGGVLALSTPNLVWWPVVALASKLKLRPYDGYEHFSSFGSLNQCMTKSGLRVLRNKGLHLIPFQLPLHGVSRWIDEHGQILKSAMINLCILAEKPSQPVA